MYVRA